jgi:hypothetical protein
MKSTNKPKAKLTSRQKKETIRRAYALRGKYKRRGLMKALVADKEREKKR